MQEFALYFSVAAFVASLIALVHSVIRLRKARDTVRLMRETNHYNYKSRGYLKVPPKPPKLSPEYIREDKGG